MVERVGITGKCEHILVEIMSSQFLKFKKTFEL